ncbi:unnamed protein product [Jaminaea pallidilutea]
MVNKAQAVDRKAGQGGDAALALVPREYQKQLLERAKTTNTIACLDTGGGKTLVAAMLIDHILALEAERLRDSDRPDKKICVFLVNLVPLVHQQASFLDANTSAAVKLSFGEVDTDRNARDWWANTLSDGTDVVVCTAQLALNAIIHAYLKLSDVSLLVFDEAHHALGNDAYVRIMSYYRLLELEKRPRIFGMTASPLLSSNEGLEMASNGLEEVLAATIFALPAHAREELSAVVARPTEIIVEYDQPQTYSPSVLPPSSSSIRSLMVANMPEGDKHFEKLLTRMDYYLHDLGPAFADLAWVSSKEEMRSKAKRKLLFAQEIATESMLNPETANAARSKSQQLAEGAAVRQKVADILDTVELPSIVELNAQNATPKLLRLLEVLHCFANHNKDFCGIIFCQRRITAIALHLLINKTPSLSRFLRSEALIGHGAANSGNATCDLGKLGMSWEEQSQVLSRLRRRDGTNLVIATSVLEEGLDIMPVNCVIRCDLPQHHVAFVQSRGRARSHRSTYVILAEKGNMKHMSLLTGVKAAEEVMCKWLAALPEERTARISQQKSLLVSDQEALEQDKRSGLLSIFLSDERTGARLSPVDAIPILAHYVSLLRTDEFCPGGPEFELEGETGIWQATVRLPASSAVTYVQGSPARSKVGAKRLAAFETCRQLHAAGQLDEHLSPRRRLKASMEPLSALEYDLQGVGEVVDGAPRNTLSFQPRVPPMMTGHAGMPASATNAITAYKSSLKMPRAEGANKKLLRNLVLITSSPLPSSSLPPIVLAECEGHRDFTLPPIGLSKQIYMDARQVANASAYTLKLLKLISTRQFVGPALPYYVLPEQESGRDIAWAEVEEAVEARHEVEKLPLQRMTQSSAMIDLRDRLLVDAASPDSGRMYRFLRVEGTLTPLDQVPGAALTVPKEGNETSFWAVYLRSRKARGFDPSFEPALLPDQPMLIGERLPRRLHNHLVIDVAREKSGRRDNAVFLIPQTLWMHTIRASVFTSARLLPSILSALQHALNCHDLNQSAFDGQIDPLQMSAALTTPSARHTHDYERLEYLGDAALKALVSCYVFANSDELVEHYLNMERRAIISNTNLLQKTARLELGTIAITRSFTRKTWCPPMVHARERPDPKRWETMNHLSPKMVADLAESIIGAAVATGSSPSQHSAFWMNLDLALTTIARFGLIPLEDATLGTLSQKWMDQVLPKALAGRWDSRLHLARLQKLEATLNYTFKYPHLALEFLTHPGHLNSSLPSYERLEHLGDAVLDVLINNWLFQAYPHQDEGVLTRLKSLAVCNQALCALCAHTKLQKYLQTDYQPSLLRAIQETTADLGFAKARADTWYDGSGFQGEGTGTTTEATSPPVNFERTPLLHYWMNCGEIKTMADIVEASIGAVFVDSGFNFQVAWRFFEGFYLPWFKRYCNYDAFVQRTEHEQRSHRDKIAADELSDSQQLPTDALESDAEMLA